MERGGRDRGRLRLCATPIGNLEDITLRALEALREADVVAAEDTRRTRRLLSRYDIHTPMVSYREDNREAAGRRLLGRLERGETVALVSDAGMPGISDPGHYLVVKCIELGIPVEALPGPSAAFCALVVSGLPTARFAFEGFLPRKPGPRRRALESVSSDGRTLVFYESPARLADALGDMLAVFGDRRAAVARELTKKFEEVSRGRLDELAGAFASREVKGEIVIVVEGARPAAAGPEEMERAVEEVLRLKEEGMSLKDAAAAVAAGTRTPISRNALYNAAAGR